MLTAFRSVLLCSIFAFVAAPLGASKSDSVLEQEIAELQARMSQLKVQVAESQTRLENLKKDATIVSDKGIRLILKLRNSLGDDFEFQRARFFLDGKKLVGVKEIRPGKDIQIYEGFIPAGEHKLKGVVAAKGANSVFSYFEDFKMRFAEEVSFSARPDAEITINFEAIKRDDMLLPLEKRPKLRADFSESFDNPNMPELVLGKIENLADGRDSQRASLGITAKNNLGKEFQLVASRIYLDGKLINPEGKISSLKDAKKLFSGQVDPGEQIMDVHLVYNGRSPLFNQFSGYHFLLKYSQKVNLEGGKSQLINLVSRYPQDEGI